MPQGAEDRIRLCQARVLGADGGPVGAGFLIGRRLVLTCAHVVEKALGLREMKSAPTADLHVDFPLFSKGIHTGTVTAWLPSAPDGSGDIAVLELHRPPSQRLSKAILIDTPSVWGNEFRTFGFPPGFDDGTYARGRLLARQATGWIEIEAAGAIGNHVQPGFSGAPVWDEVVGGFVGMVVAAARGVPALVAYVIPASTLSVACGIDVQTVRPGEPPPISPVSVPQNITLRRAYRFGPQLAFLARGESLPSTDERVRAIQFYKSACEDSCDYLGVPFPFTSPTAEGRVKIIESRIRDTRLLEEQISQSLGFQAAAAFSFGFRVGLSPEMVPFLSERTDEIQSIADLATRAGLPAEIIEEVTRFLHNATDRDSMLQDVLDHNERVSFWFEHQALNGTWMRKVHCTIWQFAKNAALAAAGLERGAKSDLVESLLRQARRFSEEIDIEPPPLFEPTGEHATDSAMALHYILVEIADPFADQLKDRYGQSALGVLRLCTRLYAMLILYHPDECYGQLIFSIIEKECESLEIPKRISEELVDSLRAGDDYETVKALIWKFDNAIGEYLCDSAWDNEG